MIVTFIKDIGANMEELAKQVVAGYKAMKAAGMDIDAPEFLDFSFQVVTSFSTVERQTVSRTGERVTTQIQEPSKTVTTNFENRGNSGGTTSTQTYIYEADA